MITIDAKLIRMGQEYLKLNDRCLVIESEIYSLQNEIDELQSELDKLEKDKDYLKNQIEITKKDFFSLKVSSINAFSNDKFTNCFIRSSYFTDKTKTKDETFQYVNITDNTLQASDRHKLIIVKCACIPDDIKNTQIKWYVRDNFKEHAKTEIEFPNVYNVLPPQKSSVLFPGVKPEEFYSIFKPKPIMDFTVLGPFLKFDFDGIKIFFNKEYVDTALVCIGGMFNLYVRDSLEPITLESDDATILLLPLRYSEEEE